MAAKYLTKSSLHSQGYETKIVFIARLWDWGRGWGGINNKKDNKKISFATLSLQASRDMNSIAAGPLRSPIDSYTSCRSSSWPASQFSYHVRPNGVSQVVFLGGMI